MTFVEKNDENKKAIADLRKGLSDSVNVLEHDTVNYTQTKTKGKQNQK